MVQFNRNEKNFIDIINENNNYFFNHQISSHLHNTVSVESFISSWPRVQIVRELQDSLTVEPKGNQHSCQRDPDIVPSVLPLER
jgi:hypothetical protein